MAGLASDVAGGLGGRGADAGRADGGGIEGLDLACLRNGAKRARACAPARGGNRRFFPLKTRARARAARLTMTTNMEFCR
jgi:hypothetical protein